MGTRRDFIRQGFGAAIVGPLLPNPEGQTLDTWNPKAQSWRMDDFERLRPNGGGPGPELIMDYRNYQIWIMKVDTWYVTPNQFCNQLWDMFDKPYLIDYPMPISAQDPYTYRILDTWTLVDDSGILYGSRVVYDTIT